MYSGKPPINALLLVKVEIPTVMGAIWCMQQKLNTHDHFICDTEKENQRNFKLDNKRL